MRPIMDILATRNLRVAEMSNPENRLTGDKILLGDVEKFIVSNDSTVAFGGDYYDTLNNKRLNFVFSVQEGWEHLSVSMPSKTPTWEQMCMMKDIFWEEEEECLEYHPRKSEYVNIHNHCLHIWRPEVDKILELYQSSGWITPGKALGIEEVIQKTIPDEKDREAIMKIYKAENGEDLDTSVKMQMYDNVPRDLIAGIPKPPYFRVGMKTKEGYEELKNYAHSKGVKVGLTDKDV